MRDFTDPSSGGEPSNRASEQSEAGDSSGIRKHILRNGLTSIVSVILSTLLTFLISALGARIAGAEGGWNGGFSDREVLLYSIGTVAFCVLSTAASVFTRGQVERYVAGRSLASIFLVLTLTITLVAVGFFCAHQRRVIAGIVLMSFAIFRLGIRHTQNWSDPWKSMRSHVAAEVYFHCVSILALAVGAALVISGIPRHGFAFPARLTLSASILLASLVAVNKVSTRARKVCTSIWVAAQAVQRAYEGLSAATASASTDVESIDKRQGMIRAADRLNVALKTRLNTGYKGGATILPRHQKKALIRELVEVASGEAPPGTKWEELNLQMESIKDACAPWIDVAA